MFCLLASWTRAEYDPVVNRSLAKGWLANPKKLLDSTNDTVGQAEAKWLVVFDNADDLFLLASYLPQWGHGNVLLTARASAVGALAFPIEVDTMSVLEGTQLLLRRAQRLETASEEENEEARNLAIALELFPLALDQAGAYIEETGCGVHDYLQLYQQHRYALLALRGKHITYPEAVATTWSISFR